MYLIKTCGRHFHNRQNTILRFGMIEHIAVPCLIALLLYFVLCHVFCELCYFSVSSARRFAWQKSFRRDYLVAPTRCLAYRIAPPEWCGTCNMIHRIWIPRIGVHVDVQDIACPPRVPEAEIIPLFYHAHVGIPFCKVVRKVGSFQEVGIEKKMMGIEFLEAAVVDLADAVAFNNLSQENLGYEFIDEGDIK